MPPCISTALSLAVHHDTSSGRGVVVFVSVILPKPGTLTKPTTDTAAQEEDQHVVGNATDAHRHAPRR
jgi:hypothetical protein